MSWRRVHCLLVNYRGQEVSSDGNVQRTHRTQMRIRIGSTHIPDPERATLSSWWYQVKKNYSDQHALLPPSTLEGPEITVNEMKEGDGKAHLEGIHSAARSHL